MAEEVGRPINSYGIAAFIYVEREGNVLVLKRAGGSGTGLWAPPGGGKEHGESPIEAVVRELYEETGLTPSGPVELIGVAPLHINDIDWIHCFYACECAVGDVVINEEHSAFRWVDPREYRERSFNDAMAESLKAMPDQLGNWIAFRDVFDRYLDWLDHNRTCRRSAALPGASV
jgi:8-oxo-dGTP diphosphatase